MARSVWVCEPDKRSNSLNRADYGSHTRHRLEIILCSNRRAGNRSTSWSILRSYRRIIHRRRLWGRSWTIRIGCGICRICCWATGSRTTTITLTWGRHLPITKILWSSGRAYCSSSTLSSKTTIRGYGNVNCGHSRISSYILIADLTCICDRHLSVGKELWAAWRSRTSHRTCCLRRSTTSYWWGSSTHSVSTWRCRGVEIWLWRRRVRCWNGGSWYAEAWYVGYIALWGCFLDKLIKLSRRVDDCFLDRH